MSTATEDNLDQLIKTIGTFQSMKGSLDTNFYNGLKQIVNNAMNQVSDHTGEYLHNLHDHQPDEDTLQKIIDTVPSSLSYEDINDEIPIQNALWSMESVHYVPLLAKEGVKHNVGGDDARGGLLLGGYNVLEDLADQGAGIDADPLYLDVMKKLRESKLLLREDIQDYHLLYHACNPKTPMRFEFLIDWCPEGLKTYQYRGLPLIHATIQYRHLIEWFSSFFKIALRYHPNDLGLLFQMDHEGQTACERAFKKYGNDKIMAVIGESIPFDDPKLPILHHVAKHVPQYMRDFGRRYPSATYFRDSQGRTLHQAKLASGHKTFMDDPMFFLEMSDEQVREIDPGSDLYPFMVAASGETCDLSAVYSLLRRNPALAHRSSKPKRRGKRKRK
jgi:hypothetical protein